MPFVNRVDGHVWALLQHGLHPDTCLLLAAAHVASSSYPFPCMRQLPCLQQPFISPLCISTLVPPTSTTDSCDIIAPELRLTLNALQRLPIPPSSRPLPSSHTHLQVSAREAGNVSPRMAEMRADLGSSWSDPSQLQAFDGPAPETINVSPFVSTTSS
jgi:hypothetical protein